MKKLEAVIRVERLRLVQEHLKEFNIGGIILHAVSWSKRRELHARYRGLPVTYDLIPVVKVEVIIPDDKLDVVVNSVKDNARTGEVGDGVIFVSNLENIINISNMDDTEKHSNDD